MSTLTRTLTVFLIAGSSLAGAYQGPRLSPKARADIQAAAQKAPGWKSMERPSVRILGTKQIDRETVAAHVGIYAMKRLSTPYVQLPKRRLLQQNGHFEVKFLRGAEQRGSWNKNY